jgi:hypothetical protein
MQGGRNRFGQVEEMVGKEELQKAWCRLAVLQESFLSYHVAVLLTSSIFLA